MWLLTGKTLYFFTVLLSGSGSILGGEALLKFPKPIVSYLAMLISPFVEYLHYTTNWG